MTDTTYKLENKKHNHTLWFVVPPSYKAETPIKIMENSGIGKITHIKTIKDARKFWLELVNKRGYVYK